MLNYINDILQRIRVLREELFLFLGIKIMNSFCDLLFTECGSYYNNFWRGNDQPRVRVLLLGLPIVRRHGDYAFLLGYCNLFDCLLIEGLLQGSKKKIRARVQVNQRLHHSLGPQYLSTLKSAFVSYNFYSVFVYLYYL